MQDRRLPESTYRVQFHAGFTFNDARAIVPYLRDLGVTHVYASPYLRARPGSTHGYDVIDHCRLNPELGTDDDYAAWTDALAQHGMSHILDIVPNHVGVATNDNAWWNDVLANGPRSAYANYFDIDWRGSPRPELHDKVLLPVLGEPYGEALEGGKLRLDVQGDAVAVYYYDRRFPTDAATLTPSPGTPGEGWGEGLRQYVASLNGTPGSPRSFDRLDELLNRQHYRLAWWRVASDEINYRRFFDINDLAALSMERQEVFDATHVLILRLVADGKVAGLRVDHPDGLYDPKQYFERLQRAHGGRDPLYVVAEKILARGESLPRDWPVHGTTGYDFLVTLNGLFVDGSAEESFTRAYHEWTGDETPFGELVYRKKLLVLDISLASELQMLAHRLDRLAQTDRRLRDFTRNGLRLALRQVIACFPVYRTYVCEGGEVCDTDRKHVEAAVGEAIRRNPRTDPSVFHFIRATLLLEYAPGVPAEYRAEQRRFAGMFQQVTAPTTAKGIEDTAFYNYNRFVSLNEVGGEPGHFGTTPAEVHAYLKDRQANWPYGLSPLSTHDTKRSEDVRARLNVLSELPDEWRRHVKRWGELNAPHRRAVCGDLAAPHPDDEYLLYQTLVGAWPLEPYDAGEFAAFVKRVQAYMQKAMREAKARTSWTDPNADYEAAVQEFVAHILDDRHAGPFLADFRPFQRQVSHFGLLNSLSQTVLRLAAPGVADTYQGTELWDFSLVDPDNRRPVDYAHRRQVLDGLRRRVESAGADRAVLAKALVDSKEDGRVKLFATWQALACRRDRPGLFTSGEYLPAEGGGARRDHVFGFARRREDQWAIAAVPRLVAKLVGFDGALPLGREVWGDTTLALPGVDVGVRFRNVFTGAAVALSDRGGHAAAAAGELFAQFPAALLISEP